MAGRTLIPHPMPMNELELAESVRAAYLRTLATAYEDAGLQGLCEEGRWEAAVGAVRSIDPQELRRAVSAERDSA